MFFRLFWSFRSSIPHTNVRLMESTPQIIEFYHDCGMTPKEIAGTLGVPLKRVYLTLNYSASGKRTLHFFPDLDTSEQQLNRAEHNRDYVSRHLHPSKED